MSEDSLKKILTVDDDDDIRMVASMILRKKGGFEVEGHNSGESALGYLDALEEEALPDLILLDVMMPVMDGPETLKRIREKGDALANIPVVFMTAKCQPEEVARLKGLGAADVIPKPFEPGTLADEVKAIWGRVCND